MPFFESSTVNSFDLKKLALAVAVVPLAAPALADTMVLEEVIVTASQREQSLQTVPMGISVLSEMELEKRGADNLGDYFRSVPGIQYTDFGATGRRGVRNLSIRGIAGVGDGGPLVGFYIDETPMTASDPTLFDVNRIEVLRGPQGTLYGAGTAGGTIKIVTNKPDSTEYAAKINASLSSTSEGGENYAIKGMLNIPLAENVAALRVSAYYDDADGFIDALPAPGGLPEVIVNSTAAAVENYNDSEVRGIRAALNYTPSERLSITPSVLIHRAEMGGEANHFPDFGDLQIFREVETPQRSDFDLYNLTVTYDFDSVSFLSSSSYYESEYEGIEDLTPLARFVFTGFGLTNPEPTPYFLDTQIEEKTQEFRLLSTNDSRFQWTTGVFYQEKELRDDSLVTATNLGVPGVPGFVAVPEFVIFGSDIDETSEEYAWFAELYYDFTEKLKLTLGARWFDYSLDTRTISIGAFGGGDTGDLSASDDGVRPKITLSYQVNDDHMLYASAAKGFRSGGVAGGVPDIPQCREALADLGLNDVPDSFSADSIWNYEAGFKSSWADNALTMNVTAFYIDWSNIAQPLRLAEGGDGSCAFTIIVNAGEATSKGLEFETWLQPVEGLTFSAAIAYTDAELGSDPAVGQEGDRLLTVPELTASLSGEYSFSINESLDGFVRADYQYIDERSYGYNEGAVFGSYNLSNLKAGITADSWQVALFANNISDSRPELGERDFGSLFRRFTTLRPRTVGLEVTKDF